MDKRIPVALVVMMILQIVGVVVSYTKLQYDMQHVKDAQENMAVKLGAQIAETTKFHAELVGIKRDISYIVETSKRLDRTVESILAHEYEATRAKNRSLR